MKNLKTIAYIAIIPIILYSCKEKGANAFANKDSIITGEKLDLKNLAKSFDDGKIEIIENLKAGKPVKDVIADSTQSIQATSNDVDINTITRDQLGGTKTYVQMYDGNTNAGISVPGFGSLKLGRKESSLSAYYVETKEVKIDGQTKIVGIGYSVHYLFKQIKGGLSADNIPTIAASVQLDGGKTKVYYSIQSYGIAGQELSKFFKPTFNKDFNVEGYGSMQVNVDGIHKIITGEISNATIRYKPEILKDPIFYSN